MSDTSDGTGWPDEPASARRALPDEAPESVPGVGDGPFEEQIPYWEAPSKPSPPRRTSNLALVASLVALAIVLLVGGGFVAWQVFRPSTTPTPAPAAVRAGETVRPPIPQSEDLTVSPTGILTGRGFEAGVPAGWRLGPDNTTHLVQLVNDVHSEIAVAFEEGTPAQVCEEYVAGTRGNTGGAPETIAGLTWDARPVYAKAVSVAGTTYAFYCSTDAKGSTVMLLLTAYDRDKQQGYAAVRDLLRTWRWV